LKALEAGGTASAALNAANEIAVEAFLARRIGFMAIAEVVERVLNALPNGSASTLDEVLAADAEARRLASEFTALLTADAPQADRVLH
jgi:1-deoxy-D-xylulose-5-phosphate reductoisomerase